MSFSSLTTFQTTHISLNKSTLIIPMAKSKFGACMSRMLKGKMSGISKSARAAKFKKAVKSCRK